MTRIIYIFGLLLAFSGVFATDSRAADDTDEVIRLFSLPPSELEKRTRSELGVMAAQSYRDSLERTKVGYVPPQIPKRERNRSFEERTGYSIARLVVAGLKFLALIFFVAQGLGSKSE